MKKVLKLLLVLAIIVTPLTVSAKEKTTTAKPSEPVNVYIFYGDTCGYCARLFEYLDSDDFSKDESIKGKYNIIEYEVWKHSDNYDLCQKSVKYFGVDDWQGSVPVTIIGKNYFSGFSTESGASDGALTPDRLKKAIKDEYKNKKYADMVAKNGKGTVVKHERASEATEEATEEKETNDAIGYIILGIAAIIIIAIIFSRSKTTYYDEADESIEDLEKEAEIAEKKTTKKTANKSTTTKSKNTKKKNK